MNDDRLTKKIYLWDRDMNNQGLVSSWTSEVKSILYSCGLNTVFDANKPFPLKCTIATIKEHFIKDQANNPNLELS